MSLQLVQSASPAFNYLGFPSTPPSFVYPLPVPNTNFQESLVTIEGFFYDFSRDVFVLIGSFDQIYWPSWKYTRLDFSPSTGALVSREDFTGGAIGFAWTKAYSNSDWKKVYAQRIFLPVNAVIEVNPLSPEPTTFQINNPVVSDADVDGRNMDSFALNREQNIIAFSTGIEPFIQRYNYATNTNLGAMKVPETRVRNIASESNELAWVLLVDRTGTGFSVAKINFINRKYELYSKIVTATPGVDQDAAIAFDPIRKSLAVFRRRTDSSTGASTHVIDIYKPIIASTILTSPVPVEELKPNARIKFVAHLSDDKGSGGGGKSVKVTKANANASLKQPVLQSRTNGSIVIPYDTPGPNATDTISLEVTV